MNFTHFVPAGGLGDCFRELWHNNALGILRRWKLLNPRDHLRVVLMSHNPASRELLDHQEWIDEIIQVPWPEGPKSWESFYDVYPALIEGREIRFHLFGKTTYDPRYDHLRTQQPVEWIDTESVRMNFPPIDFPKVDLVIHLGAGAHLRAIDQCFLEAIRPEFRNATTLEAGASFQRDGHGEERGAQLHPLSLVRTMMHAKGVIGSESSVTYIAGMLGIPFVMLYREGQTYDLLKRGESDWDFYFGDDSEGCLALKWPLSEDGNRSLLDWISKR